HSEQNRFSSGTTGTAMTALAGSTAGIGGTSTSAAPMRLRARRPGVATLRSLAVRTRAVRPAVVPPRVSPLLGFEPRAVALDMDAANEPRVPFGHEVGPVEGDDGDEPDVPEGDEGDDGVEPGPDGAESGPVGRESRPCRRSGETAVAGVVGP